MRGVSLASLTTARLALDRELSATASSADAGATAEPTPRVRAAGDRPAASPADAGAAPPSPTPRADELFALVDVLDTSPAVLRAAANPNRPALAKRTLITALMAGHDPASVAFAAGVAASRWSHDADLADAVELLGIEAMLIAIEQAGALEDFEDELFALQRFLAGQREVRLALANADATPAARAALAHQILADSLTPATMTLVEQVVRAPRHRSLTASILLLEEMSAARRGRMVATVIAGAPLTPAQRDRLAALLAEAYGRQMRLDVTVDRAVIGGVRITVGSEVLDATMIARLAALQRAIAS
jgi:F-type H+-transporting ATPase subunit delta